MDLTLNDKVEVVLLSPLQFVTYDEFERLHPEKERPLPSTVRRLKFKVLETGFIHRWGRTVIRRSVTTKGVEVALEKIVQAEPQISARKIN